MKKRITSLVLLALFLGIIALPVANAAKEIISGGESTIYGAISKDRIDDGGSEFGIETNDIYVTKSSGKYIYLTFTPGVNVKSINSIVPASGFKKVREDKPSGSNKSWTILLESTNGEIKSETKILTLTLEQEKVGEDCNIAVTPLKLACTIAGDKYYIADGTEVSKAEYEAVCGNTTPTPQPDPGEDVPTDVPTGIPVPYIAVGGGILAIAGVYLYSRKKNKMYKI